MGKTNRKGLIKEAAVKIMAELGYHASTTDRIAEEAGVAVGTIYNYFANKEEILEEIFREELFLRRAIYAEIAASDKPIFSKLQMLLEAHFNEIARNLEVGIILVREQQLPGKSDVGAISEFLQGVPGCIKELLDSAQAQGQIKECDTEIAAAALFGAVQGVVRRAVFCQDKARRAEILKNAALELIKMFKTGLV